jgi:hypothetical protein
MRWRVAHTLGAPFMPSPLGQAWEPIQLVAQVSHPCNQIGTDILDPTHRKKRDEGGTQNLVLSGAAPDLRFPGIRISMDCNKLSSEHGA